MGGRKKSIHFKDKQYSSEWLNKH